MPSHRVARSLLAAVNAPLAAPSANPFGGLSPTRAEHVARGLGERVDVILDGGPTEHGLESTIIALDPEPALLRPGAIPLDLIEAVTGRLAPRTRPDPRAAPDTSATLCAAHTVASDRAGRCVSGAAPASRRAGASGYLRRLCGRSHAFAARRSARCGSLLFRNASRARRTGARAHRRAAGFGRRAGACDHGSPAARGGSSKHLTLAMRYADKVEEGMMMPSSVFLGRVAAVSALLAVCCLGATPAGLPYQVAGDVSQSFTLLTSTYYEPIDPQVLLAAASDALAQSARKHGVTITPPALHPEGDRDATLAELDSAIETTARDAHAPPSDFAYAVIDAMAKATNDRYTQFFTPDQFKAFNEALDPTRIGGIGVMIEPDATTGCVRISYVLPSTPAERAGMKVGDIVTAVDGMPIKGLAVDAVSGRCAASPAPSLRLRCNAPARRSPLRLPAKTYSLRRSSSRCCRTASATSGSLRSGERRRPSSIRRSRV